MSYLHLHLASVISSNTILSYLILNITEYVQNCRLFIPASHCCSAGLVLVNSQAVAYSGRVGLVTARLPDWISEH